MDMKVKALLSSNIASVQKAIMVNWDSWIIKFSREFKQIVVGGLWPITGE